jgi:hypothetical protein
MLRWGAGGWSRGKVWGARSVEELSLATNAQPLALSALTTAAAPTTTAATVVNPPVVGEAGFAAEGGNTAAAYGSLVLEAATATNKHWCGHHKLP